MTINLPVRGRHYKDSSFKEPDGCPLARAGSEFFGEPCTEGVKELEVNGQRFIHKMYDVYQYEKDMKLAAELDDDTVIRFITLMK